MAARNKIIGMILLTTILIGAVKLFMPAPLRNSEKSNEFWIRKTHTDAKFNVVAGGDSRTYRGLSMETMTKEITTELTGINMGYSSGGFSSEYLDLLLEKLKTEGDRYLILGVSPHSFTLDAAKNEHYHEYKDVGRLAVFKGLYFAKYLKYFAPYSAEELRDHLNGESEDGRYVEEFKTDGWAKSYKVPEDSLVAIDIYTKIFTKYQVSDSLIVCFMDQISTIKKAGIEVIAFRPPTFDMMSNLEDSLSGYNETYIRSELESRGCVWMNFDNSDFHTYDGSHLHYNSAEKLSRLIGRRIEKLENQ